MDSTWTPVVEWLFETRHDLPPEPAERVRLLVLDTVACAIAGMRHPELAALAAQSARVAPGHASFPGWNVPEGGPGGTAPGSAAGVFTAAACWDEFGEGHERARGRPGLHSVGLPVVLAERQGLTVADVLFSVLAGYEVGARFGAALFTRVGLHVDGTWGTAAAAAAGAVALGLSPPEVGEAVGIATATPLASLYLSVPRGATARNIYAARGVSGGLECAVAAAAGMTAPDGAVAATIGLLGRDGSAAPLVPPGEFLLTSGYLKPWPGVRHAQYGITAALELREALAVTSASVPEGRITLLMHPAAVEYAGVRAPRTRLQAQFSCTYAVAHALATGGFGLEAYEPEAIADPAVGAIEERIDLVAGELVGRYSELSAGGATVRADWALGGPGHLLSAGDVRAKAIALMELRLGEDRAAELADWILTAEPGDLWHPPV